MKPFHFSLHAVRTLRQRQEQQALDTFGQAVRERQLALDRQREAETRRVKAWRSLDELRLTGAPAFRINQMRGHLLVMDEEIQGCVKACATAQETANTAWEQLQDARQQLELVEKFFVRRRDEYERMLREEEQKQLDEMAGRRFALQPVLTSPTSMTWN